VFIELIDALSEEEASILTRYLLNKPNVRRPKEYLRKIIRYKKTKKALLFFDRFWRKGIRGWHIYRCEVGLRSLRGMMAELGVELSSMTKLACAFLGAKAKSVYYVAPPPPYSQNRWPEGVLVRLMSGAQYLVANILLSEATDAASKGGKIRNIAHMRIPPYKLRGFMDRMGKKVVSITFYLNPQITGVVGVDEIEIRGSDVVNGLAYLIARLDRFRRISSLFGPPIRICFRDGIEVSAEGKISARNIVDIVEVLALLE